MDLPLFFHAFPNRKGKDANKPAFLGHTQDKRYNIALWSKRTKNGNEFFSIKISEATDMPSETEEDPALSPIPTPTKKLSTEDHEDDPFSF